MCRLQPVPLTELLSLSPGSVRSSAKPPEEALVDEEAILSLLESSQTFLPSSQTSHHSSLLGAEHTYSSSHIHFSFHLCFSIQSRHIF